MNLSISTFNSPKLFWRTSLTIDDHLPLVTCIMPTANRHDFMPQAIQYFLNQDYPYKELVIIDDGEQTMVRSIPSLYSIRYFHSKVPITIGAKRNIACEKAAGSIILHIDDDDWYARDWITHQVETILKTNADICGLNRIQYYSLATDYTYWMTETSSKKWLAGATLVYRKSFWRKHPFKNIQIGEDDAFVQNKGAKVYAHSYYQGFKAMVHDKNVRIKEF